MSDISKCLCGDSAHSAPVVTVKGKGSFLVECPMCDRCGDLCKTEREAVDSWNKYGFDEALQYLSNEAAASRVVQAESDIEAWKDASGLQDSHGDPGGVTPDALRDWVGRMDLVNTAVEYVLGRIRDDPDVGYYCGRGTDVFQHLSMAHAVVTGKTEQEVIAEYTSKELDEHEAGKLKKLLDEAREQCIEPFPGEDYGQ